MKVLHIINSFDIGGAEKLLYNYILETNSKCNSIAIFKSSNSFLYKELTKREIKFIYMCDKNPISKFIRLVKDIRNEKYDVVHAHLFPSNYYAAIASLFCKKSKFIFTEHSVTNRRRKYKIFKFIERIIYRQFDGIIACSEDVKSSLLRWLEENINVYTINNGVKEIKKIDANKEYDLITIASLRSNVKGIDILLKELSYIKDDFNNAIIIGDGVEKDNLLILRDALGLDNKVSFLGIRDDIGSMLSKSKIFVMSSRNEGFPLALLEAMSAKIPIIASNVSDIPKIIRSNENGVLVDINKKGELSRAIKCLLKNGDMRIRLGEYAYKTYKNNYNIEIYCKNIKNFYECIIKK